jgi:hypothetical protein
LPYLTQGRDLGRAVGIEGGVCGVCKACGVTVGALVEGVGTCAAMAGGALFTAVMVSGVPACVEGVDRGGGVSESHVVVAKGLAPAVLVSAAGRKVFRYLLMFEKDDDFAFFQRVIVCGGAEGNHNALGGFAYSLVGVGQVPWELCQGDGVVVFHFVLELRHALLRVQEVIHRDSMHCQLVPLLDHEFIVTRANTAIAQPPRPAKPQSVWVLTTRATHSTKYRRSVCFPSLSDKQIK